MATIIERINGGRRLIRMSTDDIISVVREYQMHAMSDTALSYREIRERLDKADIYIPEDL